MLVLGRKVGDEVLIGENVRLVVIAIRGNQVRLGFDAPREVPVRRSELESRHLRDADLGDADMVAAEPFGFQKVGVS